jgi:transcription initiation factor TFIIB
MWILLLRALREIPKMSKEIFDVDIKLVLASASAELKGHKCPECGSLNLIQDYDIGEVACGDCGLVVQDPTAVEGPEWRSYDPEQAAKRSRVGSPSTLALHDKGLSTIVGAVNRDSCGRSLSSANQAQIARLRKWQARCRVDAGVERSLANGMMSLEKFADKLGVPRFTREKTAYLYRRALEKGLVKGRTINGLVSASLYLACRQGSVLRSLGEVAEATGVTKHVIGGCYRLMLEQLELQAPPLASPVAYISRVSSRLGISCEVQGDALRLLKELAVKKYCSGKDPKAVAAALLYVACVRTWKYDAGGNLVTQKRIAAASGVTEVTIRNRYQQIWKQLGLQEGQQ